MDSKLNYQNDLFQLSVFLNVTLSIFDICLQLLGAHVGVSINAPNRQGETES